MGVGRGDDGLCGLYIGVSGKRTLIQRTHKQTNDFSSQDEARGEAAAAMMEGMTLAGAAAEEKGGAKKKGEERERGEGKSAGGKKAAGKAKGGGAGPSSSRKGGNKK